jgi:uncharacterized heparinase superfamily protein
LQASALAKRVEWHLLGNHLLANAKALVYAGAFFAGPAAERWLAQGLAIYRNQLDEQILPDGGHFERSPMYHAIILEDVLDLINLEVAYPAIWDPLFQTRLYGAANAMRRWQRSMSHPDGKIAFFNDAAFAIAPSSAQIEAYALTLGLGGLAPTESGVTHLATSGYIRLQRTGAVAILDCAPIGPDYLPGHAHADTLSFELSVGAERVVVNGGTSVYGACANRQRERGTAAHSTVTVDDANSSEVWGGFRVARRARVSNVQVSPGDTCDIVSASHDGYRRLKGRNIHCRSWHMGDCFLCVKDRISGPHQSAVARFHLEAGAGLNVLADGRAGEIVTAGNRWVTWRATTAGGKHPSDWHPEFGLSIPTQCLAIPLTQGMLETTFNW